MGRRGGRSVGRGGRGRGRAPSLPRTQASGSSSSDSDASGTSDVDDEALQDYIDNVLGESGGSTSSGCSHKVGGACAPTCLTPCAHSSVQLVSVAISSADAACQWIMLMQADEGKEEGAGAGPGCSAAATAAAAAAASVGWAPAFIRSCYKDRALDEFDLDGGLWAAAALLHLCNHV